MSDTSETLKLRPLPDRLHDLLAAAVSDGLVRVREHQEAKRTIEHWPDYPEMDTFDSGLPHFSKAFNGPLKFSSVFRKPFDLGPVFGLPPQPFVPPEEIPSWRAFLSCMQEDEVLYQHFRYERDDMPPDACEAWRRITHYKLLGIIEDFVDRMIHVSGKTEFDAALFDRLFGLWTSSILLETLPIQIVVPIVLSTFTLDEFVFDERVRIVRMDRALQLARNTRRAFTTQCHECVVGAATHAVVLDDWWIPNATASARNEALSSAEAFSEALSIVDGVIAGLRVAAGERIGYSQIVVRPIGWADDWKADLEPVYATAVRGYPDDFENYGWLRTPTPIDETACERAQLVYKALRHTDGARLAFAARRLNAAFLRSNEDDAIVDVACGLESLLTDTNSQEIRYKLRFRLAALATITSPGDITPEQIFEATARIYDFRSAVVHPAGGKPAKKRTVQLGQQPPVPAVTLGIRLLRFAIEALARHSEYLKLDTLDRFVLTRAHVPTPEAADLCRFESEHKDEK